MSASARARSPGAGRKPGQTSVAIAKAARKAGKLGGRPRDRLPVDVMERLGKAPAEAAKLRIWNARLVAELNYLVAIGEVGDDLAARIRAGATVVIKALPAIVQDVADDGSSVDDEEDRGPELTGGGVVDDEPMNGG